MKALQDKLDRAQEVNERDIPSEMLSCVPEPDLEEATTQLFDVQSFPGSTTLTKSAEAWVSPTAVGPGSCRRDAVLSGRRLLRYYVVLAPELREFLPLFSEVLLKAPTYDKDGSVVSADDNISQLRRRTSPTAAGPDC